MKKIVWAGLIAVLLACSFSAASCAKYTPKPVNQFETKEEIRWYDNGVNAVYFPCIGENFVKLLGDWQKKNPDKVAIFDLSPLPEMGAFRDGYTQGYTVFYRLK